jgi:hypothetical protein
MDPALGSVDVVVLDGDRVAAAGERGLLARFPAAELIDLGGHTVVPGFVDAHNHLSIAALEPVWADLKGVASLAELHDVLHAQADREPEAPWVRGFGWSEAETGLILDRHDLDTLGLDRPVIVTHYTLHQCVISSRGLDELGIGRTTPDPPGGEIARGAGGEPTGLLIERAWSEAHARSMAAYRDRERWSDLIAARARVLLRDGITCVHDAACPPSAERAYRRLAAAGRLPISVLMMPHAEAILSRLDAERLDGPPTGEGDEWLRIGPVKLFADGGQMPAIDVRMGGLPLQIGMLFPGLAEDMRRVIERGFGVAVHAMGNLGLDAALDAFAAAAGARRDGEHRFRIEHATLAAPSQLSRMKALGAIGVVQPGFVHHMGRAVADVHLDEHVWMPFRAIADLGIAMAASSDDPCAIHEPLRCAAHGATRRTSSGSICEPDQALPYEEWLRAYTAGAAFAGGQEDERGSLTPGKRADLVVLEGELDAEHPPRVVETWVAGTCVHSTR